MQCSLSFFYDAAIITKYCFAFLKKKTPWGGFYNCKWVRSFKTNISDGFLREKGEVEIKLIIIWSWSVPWHCWVVSRHNFLSWKHLMVTELTILESIMCCRKHSMSCGTLKKNSVTAGPSEPWPRDSKMQGLEKESIRWGDLTRSLPEVLLYWGTGTRWAIASAWISCYSAFWNAGQQT